MVDDSEEADVKLVDFGLSKTFGPGETCKEPFGTLCYVAPEILLQRSYDKSVDLWSLGVIVHLMLSGTLPFDSEDDREIARKTIYDEVNMKHPVWTKVSADSMLTMSEICATSSSAATRGSTFLPKLLAGASTWL